MHLNPSVVRATACCDRNVDQLLLSNASASADALKASDISGLITFMISPKS